MKTQVVLGTFFGDEGKGNTVQWLCKESLARGEKPQVIRFSGGPQAGHRVVHNRIEHVCSLVGSGVLLGVPTYLDRNVFIDPVSLKNEYNFLVSKGVAPKLTISPECRVITPYDILSDCSNSKVKSDGTCGCGIHATFKRYQKNGRSLEIFLRAKHTMLGYVKSCYPDITLPSEDDDEFLNALDWTKQFIGEMPSADTLIFEGSQGLLLDMDNGFMPHCTPSKVGLNGISEEFLQNAEVYLVMRSYLTRHGNGYEPKGESEIRDYYKNLEEPTNLDTGIQGKFKIGLLDLQLFRDALVRSHLDNYVRMYSCQFNAVITHMDCAQRKDVILHVNPIYKDGYGICAAKLVEAVNNDVIPINKVYAGWGPDSNISLVSP